MQANTLKTLALLLTAGLSLPLQAQINTSPLAGEETIPVKPVRDEGAVELDTVEVTGSRIKRSQVEGPLPIVSISRADIDRTGDIGLSEILRQQSFNSFGSFSPTSGSGAAQGGSTIDLRGLGSERTLVLVDGRRLPNNPAFAGAAQNINNIPLVLVDRVEILREGASAIYGSDAIGGVINIITKKDLTGFELSSQVDRPSAAGGDANTLTLAGGVSAGSGNLFFAVEHYDKGIVFNRDRPIERNLSSAFGYPGTVYRYSADGSTFNSRAPFDECPTGGFDSSAEFPDSAVISNRCRFRFASIAALTADVKRDSLLLGGQTSLTENIQGFARISATTARSFGRFAPAPVDSIVDGVAAPDAFGNLGISMAADNPNNPFPGEMLVLNYRPVFLGPRDNTVVDQVNQYLFGAKSDYLDFLGFTGWEVALSHNRYQQREIGINYGLVREFQGAIDDGSFDPFNPTDAAANSFRHTTATDNNFQSTGLDANINYDLKLTQAFTLPFVFGMEFREDDFQTLSDAESAQSVLFNGDQVVGFTQSNVFGSAGGSARGDRSYKAAYLETVANWLEGTLETGFALRFDDYSDVGNKVSPKFSLGYRPIEAVLARVSYSKGFRAPDLQSLYGGPAKSAETTVDTAACAANPADTSACDPEQRTVVFDSNPKLKPEKSTSISSGAVWSITQDWSASLDYYSVTVDDAISNLAPQAVFDNELRCQQENRPCAARDEGYVVRTSGGGLIFAYIPAANAAKLQTRGIDLDSSYKFDTDFGAFTVNGNLSRVLSYKRQDSIGGELLERLNTLNANGEIYPKWRGTAGLNWSQGAYGATLGLNYVGAVRDCDVSDVQAGDPDGACLNTFKDYTTVDLQGVWDAPWNAQITLGVRNLFDQDPRISQYTKSSADSGAFYALHDLDGQTPFVRYSQRF